MELIRATIPPETRPTTLGRYLTGPLALSTTLVRRAKMIGGIRVNGEVAKTDRLVGPGDEIALALPPREAPGVPPEPIPVAVVYEDADLIVLDKPPGLVVHPTKGATRGTLANGLVHYFREQGVQAGVHPLHRIDKDTSGLVVFAKHPLAHQRLDKQLQAREIDRRYLALVWGRVEDEAGQVELPIGLVEGHPVAREVQEGGQAATTAYEVVERFSDATLVRLKLGTGRTHQIRVHMAAIGHPLVGDGLYAEGRPGLLGRQALHAATIGFSHPRSGAWVDFESPLPEDFASLLARLRP